MATALITVRSNKTLQNGCSPLSIRLTHLRLPATYIRLKNLSCMPDEWNKDLRRFTSYKDNYKVLNEELNILERKIDRIVEQLEFINSFSYQKFKNIYWSDNKIDCFIINEYNNKISELNQIEKYGTAAFYKSSLSAINDFTKNKNITFDDITYSFLRKFIQYKTVAGVKSNSIAVYLKGLRSIHYTYCKTNDLPLPTMYSRIGVQSLIKPTRKRSLTLIELKKFMSYKSKSKHEELAKDVFMFSFYCRGINLMDITMLTKDHIVNNRIEFKRAKTSGLFSVAITPHVKIILDKYSDNNYLLPIIKNDIRLRESVRNYTKTLNRILRRIAKEINLPKELTMYWARHTFAQLLRESGVGIELISASLGHSDLKTTEVYLKAFECKTFDDITDTVFKKL